MTWEHALYFSTTAGESGWTYFLWRKGCLYKEEVKVRWCSSRWATIEEAEQAAWAAEDKLNQEELEKGGDW